MQTETRMRTGTNYEKLRTFGQRSGTGYPRGGSVRAARYGAFKRRAVAARDNGDTRWARRWAKMARRALNE